MARPALPPGFAWQPRDYSRSDPEERSLVLLGPSWKAEVALVNRRADGVTWLATTNRHLGWERRGQGVHGSRDQAIRMLTRWAAIHAGRLRAEAGQPDQPRAGSSGGPQAAVEGALQAL